MAELLPVFGRNAKNVSTQETLHILSLSLHTDLSSIFTKKTATFMKASMFNITWAG